MSLPTISVIVPTFRRPVALRRCLEALAAQDYPAGRFDIIVVDDGGGLDPALGDGLGGVRVQFLAQPNRGPATARNLGARQSAAELLAFTDDDCQPRPDWLRRAVEALADHPKALVGGAVVNALSGNVYAQASQDLVSFLMEYFPRARALAPFFTSNNMACRRDRFLALGGFDESFPLSAAEDRDLSERWAADGGVLHFEPAAVVEHFHDLTAGRFFRQHYRYGRGAVHLGRRRRARGMATPMPEPLAFYWEMVRFPLRRYGAVRGLPLAALIATSQVAGVSGMLAESVRGLSHPPAPPLPDQEAKHPEPDAALD